MGKPLVRFCEGLGYNLDQGCNIVAPPGNQAANREDKLHPIVWGVPSLLETLSFVAFFTPTTSILELTLGPKKIP